MFFSLFLTFKEECQLHITVYPKYMQWNINDKENKSMATLIQLV